MVRAVPYGIALRGQSRNPSSLASFFIAGHAVLQAQVKLPTSLNIRLEGNSSGDENQLVAAASRAEIAFIVCKIDSSSAPDVNPDHGEQLRGLRRQSAKFKDIAVIVHSIAAAR